MSVVSIKKRAEGRNGIIGSVDSQTYTETYLVKTNDRNDDFFTIINSALWQSTIPDFLEPHPSNAYFTRRNVRIDSASPLHWIAYVPYSTAPISNDERERNEFPNPIDRKAKFASDYYEFQVYRDADAEGTPYLNSAKTPFEGQPYEDARIVMPITKNIASYSTGYFSFRNTINSTPVSITDGVTTRVISEEHGLFKGFRASELKYENGFAFYSATAIVHVFDDKVNDVLAKRLDKGFYYLDGGLKKRFTVKDNAGNNQDAPTEQLLDGFGNPLGSDADPVFLDFVDHLPADWSVMPFFDDAS